MMQLNNEHHIVVNFLADDDKMSDEKAGEFAEKLERVMNDYKIYRVDATLSPYAKSLKLVSDNLKTHE